MAVVQKKQQHFSAPFSLLCPSLSCPLYLKCICLNTHFGENSSCISSTLLLLQPFRLFCLKKKAVVASFALSPAPTLGCPAYNMDSLQSLRRSWRRRDDEESRGTIRRWEGLTMLWVSFSSHLSHNESLLVSWQRATKWWQRRGRGGGSGPHRSPQLRSLRVLL